MDQPDGSVIAVTGSVEAKVPLPVIPLYDLQLAAQLIPCSRTGLQKHLSRHKEKFPAVYRQDRGGRRVRLLNADEIRAIRASMLKGPGVQHTLIPPA